MNETTDGLDQWEACPPGELERLVRGLKARRHRRAFTQLAGATGAVLLLLWVVAVAVRSFPSKIPSPPGNITCREVEPLLEDYAAGELDPAVSALLTDLKQRGMFEDTLVIWGGEFGRTPTVELTGAGASKLGRDHNHWGFSVWLAGGGIKGGTTYGATDDLGFQAVENPTSVHDLHATILHTLGFNHEQLTYRYAGRDFRLTDVHGRVIKEILA